MTLPILTERLILRRYTHEDVPDVFAFVSDPAVDRATPEIEKSMDGVQKYIEQQNRYAPFQLNQCFDLAIERRADGKVIGLLSLVRKEQEQGEIGWALGAAYRGEGYATEAAGALMSYAFAHLRLHRISATTSGDNVRSWKVMERLGMRFEGRLREAASVDGQRQDTLIYGILAHEWQQQTSGEQTGDVEQN